MTDTDLAARVWNLTCRVADLTADLPADAETVPAMYTRNRLRETWEELRRLMDDRYRAMATTAGLNADDHEAVQAHYARLAQSDPRAHLLGSLRHLRAALGHRERWAHFLFGIGGEYDARRGGEGLREAFDEASDLAELLGIERPEYPEDEPTCNRARNHWLRLRQFIDRIAPVPLTPPTGGAEQPPFFPHTPVAR